MSYFSYTLECDGKDPLALRDQLADYDGKRTFFDLDRIICEQQISVALARADRAFQAENAIANTWGIEVLLHLVGNNQIAFCIDLVGISSETTRIGIIQDKQLQPQNSSLGLKIRPPTEELLTRYELKKDEPCEDIISKGVTLVVNYE